MSGGSYEDWLSDAEHRQLVKRGWSLGNDAARRPAAIPKDQVFPVDESLDLLVDVEAHR